MDETPDAGWLPDPEQPERRRYWNGTAWTEHVSRNGVQSVDPLTGYQGQRWQYAVVNIGAFGAMDRMQLVLGSAGAQGWELVHIYDKASNWFGGMEKGFMLLKRPVAAEVTLTDEEWCLAIKMAP